MYSWAIIILYCHLHLGLANFSFLHVYPPKFCMQLISPPYATCPNHPVLDLITQEYFMWGMYHEDLNYIVFSTLILYPFFFRHPLFSVSYYRNLNCNNKINRISIRTCTAVHCARYVYSCLEVSNGIMSHPPSSSSVSFS